MSIEVDSACFIETWSGDSIAKFDMNEGYSIIDFMNNVYNI